MYVVYFLMLFFACSFKKNTDICKLYYMYKEKKPININKLNISSD